MRASGASAARGAGAGRGDGPETVPPLAEPFVLILEATRATLACAIRGSLADVAVCMGVITAGLPQTPPALLFKEAAQPAKKRGTDRSVRLHNVRLHKMASPFLGPSQAAPRAVVQMNYS